MNEREPFDAQLQPVGWIESALKHRREAPRQGNEGAPEAWLTVTNACLDCVDGLEVQQDVIVLTWLHRSDRDVRKVHPRGNPATPLTGVFATRSPDRPNPIGLHRVTILEISGGRLRVAPLEAIDGTPVIDIKPVLFPSSDA
jgi:tRNA-Thr(GGU) m(6)t(6)A37 methyltransferase TsaA